MRTRPVSPDSVLASKQWVQDLLDERLKRDLELQSRMLTAASTNALNTAIEEERKWVEDRIEEWADSVVEHLHQYVEEQRLHRRIGRAVVAWYRRTDLAVGRLVFRFVPAGDA